jgi:hypothetical protein
MKGYMHEIDMVGVIDNDDMKQYAWDMQQKATRHGERIDPTQITWSI